jgi:hypothetical protein
METVEVINLSLSILSMIIGILSHIRHSKCSNCCEIDFDKKNNDV